MLGYVLKHFKHLTTAVIIGFISGSLGVVWPWKRVVYKIGENGRPLTDSNGDAILANYQRYWPDFGEAQNLWALVLIAFGIGILIALEWYGKNRLERKNKPAL